MTVHLPGGRPGVVIEIRAVAPPLIDTPAIRAFVPMDIPAHAVSSEAIPV
jgi:hypothetical protein